MGKRHVYKPPVDELRQPAGSVIAEFDVPYRPSPWKVPFVSRRGAIKDAKLILWQESVALLARVAMGSRLPYAGPVRIEFLFLLALTSESQPDLTNLVKSTEDALQGIVIANDTQVDSLACDRYFGDTDGVQVRVLAL